MIDFSPFIGLAQKDLGRDPSGVDCWGLYFLAARANGLLVPSYLEGYVTVAERAEIGALIARETALPTWARVTGTPEPLDCIVFRRGAFDGHVGCVVDRRRMLHVDRRAPSRIERFDIAPWSERPTSVWRWMGERA